MATSSAKRLQRFERIRRSLVRSQYRPPVRLTSDMDGYKCAMKALLIGVVLVVVCIVLFITGVISPAKSRKMQGDVGELARKGERRGDEKAGWFGDATRAVLEKSRSAADASARAGRLTHDAAKRGARSSRKDPGGPDDEKSA